MNIYKKAAAAAAVLAADALLLLCMVGAAHSAVIGVPGKSAGEQTSVGAPPESAGIRESSGEQSAVGMPLEPAGEQSAVGMPSEPSGIQVSSDEQEAGEPRFLALTFDDGPHGRYTARLLDGLKERGVKATFFLVGKNIEGNEELVKRMSDEGHLIGVHCYSHEDFTRMTVQEACDQIERTGQIIREITGQEPVYFRPPFGKGAGEIEEELGMTPVLWDIDPRDWSVQNRQTVARHILKQAPDHQVVLLHDVFLPSVEAALDVIDTLGERGYTFVTADELEID